MGRQDIITWVSNHILPHEQAVRRWLRGTRAAAMDVDDIIQEAYCRIAALQGVDHIGDGKAYFFQTARNVLLESLRRVRVVRIDSVSDIQLLQIVDEAPSPERVAAGLWQLTHVQSLIEGLPRKCREVFILRRVHGVSQKEIARRLGISESTVEMHASRGLRHILAVMAGQSTPHQGSDARPHREILWRRERN